MKKNITLIIMSFPCIVSSQAMHLSPNTRLPINKVDKTPVVNSIVFTKADSVSTVLNTVDKNTGKPLTYVTKYNATVFNTDFTIPLVRVNFLVDKPMNSTNSLASTSFLNSAGAGLKISTGELDVTSDSGGNNISIDYHNQFGFQVGFLFAANSASGKTTDASGTTTTPSSNIFALVAGVSILNFQLGGGYELGSLASGQRRGFLTIAYAIPMSVLVDGGYKILKMSSIQK